MESEQGGNNNIVRNECINVGFTDQYMYVCMKWCLFHCRTDTAQYYSVLFIQF